MGRTLRLTFQQPFGAPRPTVRHGGVGEVGLVRDRQRQRRTRRRGARRPTGGTWHTPAWPARRCPDCHRATTARSPGRSARRRCRRRRSRSRSDHGRRPTSRPPVPQHRRRRGRRFPPGYNGRHDRDADLSHWRALLDRHRAARQGRRLPLLRRAVRLDVRGRDASRCARLLPDRQARRPGCRRDRHARIGLDGRRGTPTSPSTTPTPPRVPWRRPAVERSPLPTRADLAAAGRLRRPDRCAVPRVADRGAGSAPRSSTRPGRGTSATCTRPTRRGRRRSTPRSSVGRPTSSTSVTARERRCGAGPGTASTSRRRSIRTSTLDRTAISAPPGLPTPSPGWHRSDRTRRRTGTSRSPSPIATRSWRRPSGSVRPIVSGPVDTAWTRSAVVRDPHGATFTLSQFTPGGP